MTELKDLHMIRLSARPDIGGTLLSCLQKRNRYEPDNSTCDDFEKVADYNDIRYH